MSTLFTRKKDSQTIEKKSQNLIMVFFRHKNQREGTRQTHYITTALVSSHVQI